MYLETSTTAYARARWAALPLLAGLLAIAGCNSSSDNATATGTASFLVTDAPVDNVTEVFVTFDRIDLSPQGGQIQSFELEEPRRIDLLTLQGGNAAPLIEDLELPAGEYNFIRLFVVGGAPESQVTEADPGGVFDLFIPGNQPPSANPNQRFLQLSSPFVIPAGGHADFTIDVELRKALVQPSAGDFYMLRPSLRLVDNSEVGMLAGIVADSLVLDAENCTNNPETDTGSAVYVYTGFDALPGDVFVDEDGEEQTRTDGAMHPLTLANVLQDPETGEYEYTVGFLPAGDYTVAFTCQASDDAPETEDDIAFAVQENVSITAGETTGQDLGAVE